MYQYGYQPNFQIQTKICQRARGPHTEGEIYCGRTLTMDHFSKGRAQCKECSVKKTQVYNQSKVISQQPSEALYNHIQELEKSIISLKHELYTISESLKIKTLELNESQIQYKKYYDGALEYYNETIKLKEDFEIITLSNNELLRKDKLIQSELENKTGIIKSSSETISSLQKENRELKSVNITLNNDIKTLNDEIRVLERKR